MNIYDVYEVLSWACLLAGSFFIVVGAFGVLRMPDFFTRLHPAGLTDTLGAGLIIAGMLIESGWTLNFARLLMILFFLGFTSPTSTHALSHAALTAGLKPWRKGDKRQSDAAAAPQPGDGS